MAKWKPRNILSVGEIKYLQGYKSSSVEVLQFVNEEFVLCRIQTAPAGGKYEKFVGQNVYINRRVLYPRGER